jgi:hypothetical protein
VVRPRIISIFAFCLMVAVSAISATVTNYPVADTMLSETFASNNFGAMTFASSGTTQNFTKNRALYRFDIAGSLPANSRVLSAFLVIEVVKSPSDGYNFADFGLYRLLRGWGEGNKVTPSSSGNAGTGAPAGTNEATWLYRFAFSTNTWAAPGGAPGMDYIPSASAVQTVYSLGDSPYTFGPAPAMTGDVQFWLDHPQNNFGWMLICASEETDFTARRFGARENTVYAPYLVINYLVAPRIDKIQRNGTSVSLYFAAHAGQSYVIEFQTKLGVSSWQTLATLDPSGNDTQVVVIDTAQNPSRFYRIRSF